MKDFARTFLRVQFENESWIFISYRLSIRDVGVSHEDRSCLRKEIARAVRYITRTRAAKFPLYLHYSRACVPVIRARTWKEFDWERADQVLYRRSTTT